MNNKLLLIGGYPKGYEEPFHTKTPSGKILRGILKKNKIEAVLFDLWCNEKEENREKLSSKIKLKLLEYHKKGFILVALGRKVQRVLNNYSLPCNYLPHPASRNKNLVLDLEKGLRELNGKL
ncbi:hypothetical protein COY26_03855 [Candidatus Woesearchaeota archaeon CG_4_10_14_0_2_um_filter_33_10]|nr:MAG: hypothetical protein COY26_03855 [Candidatus Woesearchaeota archaeon CG_4_10_14_0_2_um_filter_33_10]